MLASDSQRSTCIYLGFQAWATTLSSSSLSFRDNTNLFPSWPLSPTVGPHSYLGSLWSLGPGLGNHITLILWNWREMSPSPWAVSTRNTAADLWAKEQKRQQKRRLTKVSKAEATVKARPDQWPLLSVISRDLKQVTDWETSIQTRPYQYRTQIHYFLTDHFIFFLFASLKA